VGRVKVRESILGLGDWEGGEKQNEVLLELLGTSGASMRSKICGSQLLIKTLAAVACNYNVRGH
jgi:hypothetical protein